MLFTLIMLTGCEQIDKIKGTVDGLTNPLVSQTIVLGVAEPDSKEIDLKGTEFDKGTLAQVFLADAASVNEIESAPISGADVKLRIGSTAAVWFNEDAGGAYSASGDDGLVYAGGEEAALTVEIGEDVGEATLTLPQPPTATIRETHAANTAMQVELEGVAYDAVLGVVINVTSGEITWQNRPEGIREVYDLTHGDGGVTSLNIPATAFPAGCVCAVGVAGLMNAASDAFVNQNTGLSSFTAGQMKFWPVLVN